MTTFGISHSEVFSSVWFVVEAVNNLEDFEIIYPADHIKQRQIADGFLEASAAGFECCAGAIDGILIWIHKPSDKDCALSGCDPGKFFCGRKHKFGLNCQAVCDARGRILDMAIQYPGSTSDILAFEGMSLYDRLEDGLLAPGLCLFGDNAYLNTPYMATPYLATCLFLWVLIRWLALVVGAGCYGVSQPLQKEKTYNHFRELDFHATTAQSLASSSS
jgi:hypothetical protein